MTDTANNTVDAVRTSSPATICSEDIPMRKVSIDTPEADLRNYLGALVRGEARLFDAGITCDLKDQDDMSCLACPLSKAKDPDDPKSALCRRGQAQEVVTSTLLAQRASGV